MRSRSLRVIQISALLIALPFLVHWLHRAENPVIAPNSETIAGADGSVAEGISPTAVDDEIGTDPTDSSSTAAEATPIATVVGRRGTLDGALAELGLEPDSRHRIIRALRDDLDLRRLSPDTGLIGWIDTAGALARLAIRAEPGTFVRVHEPLTDSPQVERVELPVVSRIEKAGGAIASSVHQALSDSSHHGHQLTLAYADIMQWDVDLLVDPRPGDEIRIIYEAQYVGEVPQDMPSFGDRASRPGQFLRIARILAASYEGNIANARAFWVDDSDGSGGYFDDDGRPLQKAFLKSPLNYRRISSKFSRNRRHPITRRVVPHHGVDFAAASGTPVVAAADGRVVSSGWDGPLGRAIRLRHGSEYVTVYGHLKGVAKGISTGAEVRQNQVIGYVGATGRATGPHLHYTLLVRGKPVDPLRFRSPSAAPLRPELLPSLDRAKAAWAPVLGSIPIVARNRDDPGHT